MICERCKGKGTVEEFRQESGCRVRIKYIPCPDCTGGVAHCCDGIQEQPNVYQDQKLYSDGFKAGYAQAIGDADEALKKHGDDRQTRLCRQRILILADVKYNPNEAMPIPDWSNHSGKK